MIEYTCEIWDQKITPKSMGITSWGSRFQSSRHLLSMAAAICISNSLVSSVLLSNVYAIINLVKKNWRKIKTLKNMKEEDCWREIRRRHTHRQRWKTEIERERFIYKSSFLEFACKAVYAPLTLAKCRVVIG